MNQKHFDNGKGELPKIDSMGSDPGYGGASPDNPSGKCFHSSRRQVAAVFLFALGLIVFVRGIGVLLVFCGVFVAWDAWLQGIWRHPGKRSFTNLSPAGWGMAIMGLSVIALPIYSVIRKERRLFQRTNFAFFTAWFFFVLVLASPVIWYYSGWNVRAGVECKPMSLSTATSPIPSENDAAVAASATGDTKYDCRIQHHKGKVAARVCWIIQVKCKNGVEPGGDFCTEVDSHGWARKIISIKALDNGIECDFIISSHVEGVTVKPSG